MKLPQRPRLAYTHIRTWIKLMLRGGGARSPRANYAKPSHWTALSNEHLLTRCTTEESGEGVCVKVSPSAPPSHTHKPPNCNSGCENEIFHNFECFSHPDVDSRARWPPVARGACSSSLSRTHMPAHSP